MKAGREKFFSHAAPPGFALDPKRLESVKKKKKNNPEFLPPECYFLGVSASKLSKVYELNI